VRRLLRTCERHSHAVADLTAGHREAMRPAVEEASGDQRLGWNHLVLHAWMHQNLMLGGPANLAASLTHSDQAPRDHARPRLERRYVQMVPGSEATIRQGGAAIGEPPGP
jgi:hypothetical protein